MSVLTLPKIAAAREQFFFENADWELCRKIVGANPNRRMRLSFANNRLFIMSPLPIHDKWKKTLARLIESASEEIQLPISSFGSSTWIHDGMQRAIESDECYYIANESVIRGRADIDLNRDPPPDLAIEVDVTHSPVDRIDIYAELGVPELWVYDGRVLRFLELQNKSYRAVERSIAFPFVSTRDIETHLALIPTVDELSLITQWRVWVRNHAR